MSMTGSDTRSVQGLTDEDRRVLRKAILEMNDSMTRVSAERDLQKEIISETFGKLGVDKKLFRRMAKTYYKSNFRDEVEADTVFEDFYSTVIEKTAP